MDWRRFERSITKTAVVSPEEGALRVIAELSRFSPECPVTASFEPRSFQLDYVSSTRRAHQRSFQPAWVAVLDPKGEFGVGKVIAVPAAKAEFGPLIETVRPMGVVPQRR